MPGALEWRNRADRPLGNCNFTVKVKNAQDAGAIAVIIVNNVPGSPVVIGGTDNTHHHSGHDDLPMDGLFNKTNEQWINATLAPGQNMDGDRQWYHFS